MLSCISFLLITGSYKFSSYNLASINLEARNKWKESKIGSVNRNKSIIGNDRFMGEEM